MPDAPTSGAQGPQPLSGEVVGRFAVRERLGEGGMGEVYRAEDTKLRRSVALKRMAPHLRSDPHYRHRFLKEAERASGFSDPHIASLYDILEDGEELFLVMEFVEGRNLHQRLCQPMTLEEFLHIAQQCVSALATASAHGIVHLDIKPENIMITSSGAVKVLDFGIARRLSRAGMQTTATTVGVSGTSGYMAPEIVLEMGPTPASDIFSLGVVFYEALAGFHPFLRPSFFETCERILHVEPAPLDEISGTPRELAAIVRRMMEKDPGLRYPSAAELIEDLKAVPASDVLLPTGSASQPGVLNAPTTEIPITQRLGKTRSSTRFKTRARTRRRLAAGIAVVLIAGLAVMAGFRPGVRRWARSLMGWRAQQIAVLPFKTDGDVAFATGLTESITARLGELPEGDVQVVPASEVANQKADSVEKVRQQFGVDKVITGSLRTEGNLVRANYSLVDARTNRQLRGDSMLADAGDPFALEDQIVASLLRSLNLESPGKAAHGTTDASAYVYYLRGRGYLQDYTKPENLESAITAFKGALERDSNYALAYSGLGLTYWHKSQELRDSTQTTSASMACERALAIDPKLAQARVCLGNLYTDSGKYDQAVQQFQEAVKTEPANDEGVRGLALAYERAGQFAEAETTYKQAITLRPSYWANYNWLGTFYWRKARYQEAATAFQRVISLAPDNPRGYSNLGGAYILQGRFRDAIPMFQRSVSIRPNATGYTNLGTAYFHLRQYRDAVQAYGEAVRLNDRDHSFLGNLADAQYWAPGLRGDSAQSYRRAIELAEARLKVNPRDGLLLASLALYHAMLDEKATALNYLAQAQALGAEGPELARRATIAYVHLGERDQALAQMAKWFAAGGSPAYVRAWPDFDTLSSDPRYQQLMKSAESIQPR